MNFQITGRNYAYQLSESIGGFLITFSCKRHLLLFFGYMKDVESYLFTSFLNSVPPSIMKDVSPRSVLCAKETSCSFLCHATSDIPFNYSWTRNGQALDGHNIKVMNNSVIITPLDDQDFGDYVCHVTNSFGSTTYKITLSESREEGNSKCCQC